MRARECSVESTSSAAPSSVTLGPKGRNVAIDRSFGAKITKDGVSVAREIELERQVREYGRPDGSGGRDQCLLSGRRRHHHGSGAGPHDRQEWRQGGGRGHESDGLEARHRSRGRSGRGRPRKASSEGHLERRDRADRHDLGQRRRGDRPHHRRRHEQGRQRRRDHDRGRDDAGDRGRGRPRHPVRPQLHLASFRHRPQQDGGGDGGRLRPHQREEALQHQRIAAAPGEGRPDRQAAAHHRRRLRGRGDGGAGGQQAARQPQGRGRQGPRLRRASQVRFSRISLS